jgi:site-specific recombinase XerC
MNPISLCDRALIGVLDSIAIRDAGLPALRSHEVDLERFQVEGQASFCRNECLVRAAQT